MSMDSGKGMIWSGVDEEEQRRRLVESNTENPQNPSSDEPEPMVCDEEEELRRKKGKSKIVYEDDDYEENEMKQSFDHLNEASSSMTSSFQNLCFSEPCLLSRSEKMGTKYPPNPNYHSSSPSMWLPKYTNRMRRAMQQRLVTETPEWVYEAMRDMNAYYQQPTLIFDKTLSSSDVNSNMNRLLIPFKKLIRNDFLTREECRAMNKQEDDDKEEEEEDDHEKNIGVGTILVSENNQKGYDMWGLRLEIWAMNGNLSYVLKSGWNDVVKANDLKAGDHISLWIFRCGGVLCFALDILSDNVSFDY